MAKIVTKLNLNKTPQQVENNSLIFAKNIKLLKDGSISADSSFNNVIDSFNRVGNIEDLQKGYVGEIVGINNVVYFFLNLAHSDQFEDVHIYKYNEEEDYEIIDCGWHYSGGKITGCTTINNTGEEILTICEYFEDDDHPKVPIKHINLAKYSDEDNESIYTQHPDLPISNLFLTDRYTCNIPNGVYQFFIRYRIRKDFYTPWIPCSAELYSGTTEVTSTIQGQIKHINLHKDSANSFVFTLHHCFEDVNWYEKCQLGFILSNDDAAVARSWKHFDLTQDQTIYFDYDQNSIEEINIDDLTRTNFELFNVKNICYYKNKEYIANYEETDFNPDLQDIADDITVSLDYVELDGEDNIILKGVGSGVNPDTSIAYPEYGYFTDTDLAQAGTTATIRSLLTADSIISAGSEEGTESTEEVIWKVKARNYYDVYAGVYTTDYLIWWLSKGEALYDYNDGTTSYKDNYCFTYYDDDSEIECDGFLIDGPNDTLELLHDEYNDTHINHYFNTYNFNPTTPQPYIYNPPSQHKLAAALGDKVDTMWYWCVGSQDSYGHEDELFDKLYDWSEVGTHAPHNFVDPVLGYNSDGKILYNKDFSEYDTNQSWFAIGNIFGRFHSENLGNDTNNKRRAIGEKISTMRCPLTNLTGLETWKRQLTYMLELKYPKCLVKRAYYYLAGVNEPILIAGANDYGVNTDGDLKGIKANDIQSYIASIQNSILNKVVAIDEFGNCYAKVDPLSPDMTPNNVKAITQFGVEYCKITYDTKVDANGVRYALDTEDLDGSSPEKASTVNFETSYTYKDCFETFTIKYTGSIEVNTYNYDYPTLMPFTEYEFYVHFVKQSGIATNGYKIGEAISYDSYPSLRIIYPRFSNIPAHPYLPEGYTSVFFSYAKVKNNIAKCFNHRIVDGYHYVDCLECDLLLYNLDKNITIFHECDTNTPATTEAEYYSSGSTKYLPLFGNCGVIRWKVGQGEIGCSNSWNGDDFFIKIENDATNIEYKKLVKLTPYLTNDLAQTHFVSYKTVNGELIETEIAYSNDENGVSEYIANLNSPARICGIKKLSHTSDSLYVTGNDVYNKTATGSEITVDMNTSLLSNIPSRTFYLPSNYNLNYINLSEDINPQIRKPTDDSNIEIIKQIIQYTQSMTSSSVAEHPSMYRDFPRKYYVAYEDEHITIFNNTIRSSNVNTDELYRHIYTFDSEDYYNVPTNRGVIVNMFNLSDFIYVHNQHALFRFAGANSLHSDEGKVEFKEGDVFDSGIKEIFDSQYGHAGLMKKEQSCITFTAYFFYDAYAKIIYAYGGETQLVNISDPIRKLLDEYKPIDIKFVADENHDRVFINLINGEDVVSVRYDSAINEFYYRGINDSPRDLRLSLDKLQDIVASSQVDYDRDIIKWRPDEQSYENEILFLGQITNHYRQNFVSYLYDVVKTGRYPEDPQLAMDEQLEDIFYIINSWVRFMTAWFDNALTYEEFRAQYETRWNTLHTSRTRYIVPFDYMFPPNDDHHKIFLVFTFRTNYNLITHYSSNICLSYNFKNKGYISIHDFDFYRGFATRTNSYFVSLAECTPRLINNQTEITRAWEINKIDKDIARYTCYNGAYKPSDIGSPETDDMTNPAERRIRTIANVNRETYERTIQEIELQLDEATHYIVPSVIDVICNGDYEKIKNLEYIHWIASVVDNYGFNMVNYAEEELDARYSATKLRIYSDQTYTDLIQVVDDTNEPIVANEQDINNFNFQKYPRFNCGIWSLNYFRDIKNSSDLYQYEPKTPLQQRTNNYKYVQEDSLIYGKYIVLRLIYWNKRYKLENVEFKVNNYGKIS